jgi:hypothetical protein
MTGKAISPLRRRLTDAGELGEEAPHGLWNVITLCAGRL